MLIEDKNSGKPLINIYEFLFYTSPQLKEEANFWFKYTLNFFEKHDPNNIDRALITLGLFCSSSNQSDSYNKVLCLQLYGMVLQKTERKQKEAETIQHLIEEAKQCFSDEEKLNERLSLAKANSELLLNMIYDILDQSQLKNRKIKPILSEFLLKDPISEVTSLMKIQTDMKKIELKIENNFEENLLIKNDSRRLKQVLINMIGNAIKFTSNGYILLKTYLEDNVISFLIEDTGVGISPEILPKLAEMYATFDNAQGMNKEGIGLGLHICKKIIGILGPEEKIKIESELNQGSRFSFEIYLNLEEKDHRVDEVNCDSFASVNFSDVSEFISSRNVPMFPLVYEKIVDDLVILIADDNVFNLTVLEAILHNIEKLENRTFIIKKAYNGKEAVDIYEKCNKIGSLSIIDVIIMDIQMPVMDGIESLKKIREMVNEKKCDNCEIIAYSANLNKKDKIYYKNIGFDSSLLKPAEQKDLHLALKRLKRINKAGEDVFGTSHFFVSNNNFELNNLI